MPSKSKPQQNMMRGVAHDPAFAKKMGIPQSVGQDFVAADKAQGVKFNKGGHVGGGMTVHNYCAGGKVISSRSH